MSQEDESIVVEPSVREEQASTENQAPAPEPVQAVDPLASLRLPDDESIDATYRGKTAKDLIEMHRNATSRIGDQGRELGVWRNLVNDLSQNVTRPASPATERKELPELTPESLLTNPQEVLSNAINRAIEDRLAPLNQDRQREVMEREEARLRSDFPTAESVVATPEFQTWATSKAGRKADLEAAAKGDMLAGRRLLETWSELHPESPTPTKPSEDKGKPQGLEGARQAVTEAGGGTKATTSGKIYYQADIVDMIVNNPDKYNSNEFQREIAVAAKEGRIRA